MPAPWQPVRRPRLAVARTSAMKQVDRLGPAWAPMAPARLHPASPWMRRMHSAGTFQPPCKHSRWLRVGHRNGQWTLCGAIDGLVPVTASCRACSRHGACGSRRSVRPRIERWLETRSLLDIGLYRGPAPERARDLLSWVLRVRNYTHYFGVRTTDQRAWLDEHWLDGVGEKQTRVVKLSRPIPRTTWVRIAIEVALDAPRLMRVTFMESRSQARSLQVRGRTLPSVFGRLLEY